MNGYKLKQHQVELQDFLDKSPGLGVLGWHGMGLGKTLSALDYARKMKAMLRTKGIPNAKFLVICPKSAVVTWKDECQKRTPDLWASMLILPISQIHKARRVIAHHDIRFLVIDESHYLKNPEADRTKEVARVLDILDTSPGKFEYGKILKLTGTPFLNNAGEFYPTWAMLCTTSLKEAASRLRDASRFANWKASFTNQETLSFNKRGDDGVARQVTVEKCEGVKNVENLTALLKDVIHYRRVTDCLDMPLMNKFTINLNIKDDALLAGADIRKPAEYMAVLERLSRAKTPHAIDWIKEFQKNSDEQLVVFSMYTEPLQQFKEAFKKNVVVISGAESSAERARNIKRFQSGEIKIIVLTYGAGAESLNLQNACYALYLGFPWTAAKIDQAIARTWRQGQARPSFHYFLMSGESDYQTFCKVEGKREASESIEDNLLEINNIKSIDDLI